MSEADNYADLVEDFLTHNTVCQRASGPASRYADGAMLPFEIMLRDWPARRGSLKRAATVGLGGVAFAMLAPPGFSGWVDARVLVRKGYAAIDSLIRAAARPGYDDPRQNDPRVHKSWMRCYPHDWFAEVMIATFGADGTYHAEMTTEASADGDDWRILHGSEDRVGRLRGSFVGDRLDRIPSLIRQHPAIFNAATSAEATASRFWFVDMTFSDADGSVRLRTDALGIRETFALRDIPAGKSRRAALRHWVREHWRQTRGDAKAEHFVRAHLRGSDAFEWSGLRCKIHPATDEVAHVAAHGRLAR